MNPYEILTCRGLTRCPNAVFQSKGFEESIDGIFGKISFEKAFLEKLKREPKRHEVFRVSVSCCPNGCSSPQIADIGIVFVARPEITGKPCAKCFACQKHCPDKAIDFPDDVKPAINRDKCLDCGKCAVVCPTKTIETGKKGFKIMVGGKLGRKPRLASYIPGIFAKNEILRIIENVLLMHLEEIPQIRRFGEVFFKYEESEIITKLLPR